VPGVVDSDIALKLAWMLSHDVALGNDLDMVDIGMNRHRLIDPGALHAVAVALEKLLQDVEGRANLSGKL